MRAFMAYYASMQGTGPAGSIPVDLISPSGTPRRHALNAVHHKLWDPLLAANVLAEGAQHRVSCGAGRRATRQHASRRVLGAAGGAEI